MISAVPLRTEAKLCCTSDSAGNPTATVSRENIAHGAKMIMPGPGAQPVDMTGNVLDRKKFAGMLKEYYQLRGWDEKTGLPTRETLKKLGMEDMIQAIQSD